MKERLGPHPGLATDALPLRGARPSRGLAPFDALGVPHRPWRLQSQILQHHFERFFEIERSDSSRAYVNPPMVVFLLLKARSPFCYVHLHLLSNLPARRSSRIVNEWARVGPFVLLCL